MIDVDVFIAFYTCTEGSKIHRHLLERCIESARREEVRNIYVIDGSRSDGLKEGEFDAELIRNEKHALAFAINIAIETAREDFFLLAAGSIIGIGALNNMIFEKREIEREYGKPAAIVAREAGYPTEDKLLLRSPMAGTVETIKKELGCLSYQYTDEGISIAEEPRNKWKKTDLNNEIRIRRLGYPMCYSARTLSASYLVNKNRLLEIGGSDERCYCIDYDMGMRWISFGWPLLTSDSANIHRITGTTNMFCKERELDMLGTFCHYCGIDLKSTTATRCPICKKDFTITDRGRQRTPSPPASFRAWMKYEKPLLDLFQHTSYVDPLNEDPFLYRKLLKPFYREEYDRLKEKPFFLGRE